MRAGTRLLFAASLALAPLAPAPAPAAATVVRIETGEIEGAVSDGVASFKGIPFAAPPVGALRWRAPQPPAPWDGVRPATAFGHDCMQLAEPSDAAPPGTTPDEDCLVVNVWRPAETTPGEKLPVLFWIHGGGYVNGGSSPALYDGGGFARQGLVVVSANYRLGRFGFFVHPALLAAGEGPVGNFGYQDQLAALRWVQRNVAAFGGDPARVTIVGESAGGGSVLHLLVSPAAKGLFQRAAVLSGGGRGHLLGGMQPSGGTPAQPSADQVGAAFAKAAGVAGDDAAALAALRALPADVVRGDLNMSALMRFPADYAMGPIVDGEIVVATPAERLRRGEGARVPILIGTTGADLPLTLPPSRGEPYAMFGADAERARALYDPADQLPPLRIALILGADLTMQEPARFVAKQATRAGAPAWLYRFDYVPESLRAEQDAAPHAGELPFVFDTLPARYGAAATDADRAMARVVSGYFANFAKGGDPNGPGLPAWPKYAPARPDLMLFTNDGAAVRPDPWQERLDLIERALDRPPR